MNSQNIDELFDKIAQQYKFILSHYYPTHDSLGFTESNLSVAFVEAYKSIYPNTIAWFEAPLNKNEGQTANPHIDVVLFDLDSKSMIMIESKRLFSERKLESAKRDLNRILTKENYEYLSENLKNITITHKYAIILADIWLDKPHKRKRLQRWQDKSIFSVNGQYLDRMIIEESYYILGYIHKIN